MKFQVMSDVHQEGSHDPLITKEMLVPGIDALLLAGDITNDPRKIKYLESLPIPIYYIMGNHEYYLQHWDNVPAIYEPDEEDSNIHVMEMSQAFVGNVRIIAATMWTDNYWLKPDGELVYVGDNFAKYMMDAHHIRGFSLFRMENKHKQSIEYIRESLKYPHDGPTIVMTHHTPSYKSVHPKYGDDPSNAYFSSHLDHIIEEFQPEVWVHGHTHSGFDYHIGKTRVVCNPMGYRSWKGLENDVFNDKLVIDIG